MENNCIECENETMLELSSLQVDFQELKDENELLKKMLDSATKYYTKRIENLTKMANKCEYLSESLKDRNKKLDIFRNDEYFDGLGIEQIAGLAKKSIRITSENRYLNGVIEQILTDAKNIDIGDVYAESQNLLKDIIEIAENTVEAVE